ncbi:MAG: protein phosphatase 2C domain-containing protein [Thiohalocapsa sp.]
MTAASQGMRRLSAAATHAGVVRTVNQDAFLERSDIGLWVVADGMGGHAAGEKASALVVESLSRLPADDLLGRSVRRAECLISEANRRLIDEADASGEPVIGTTVVALLAAGNACALLWVGDSRIYRLRGNRLEQLTVDHTEVQQWVTEGKLSVEEAETHPYASVLSRAVGAEDALKVDAAIETLMDGDRYLLCSDGLTKELSPTDIQGVLGCSDPEETVRLLIESACAAGGRDNVTAVVIDFINR